MTEKQKFIERVRGMSCIQLEDLFSRLQADGASLGILMFISSEYALRKRGMVTRRILD